MFSYLLSLVIGALKSGALAVPHAVGSCHGELAFG
jgi:hypothetical protein